ncbi:MAG: recombination protein RecR [Clostridia bacterium]|nr:recombination protein RecR [Clostridia bacterium]
MAYNIVTFNELAAQFERLPSIGKKTAQRLALFVLEQPKDYAVRFANALTEAKDKIHHCKICSALTDTEVCSICSDTLRDKSVICVVESAKDVMAFERMREYRGLYHVLNGVISPLDGIGPDKLKIKELLSRLADGTVTEVIMATNPTVEGEATASYISRLIKPMGLKITRLAYGIPVGGDLEYADSVTLLRALDGRNEL